MLLSEGEEKAYEELKRILRPQYLDLSATQDSFKDHLRHRKLVDKHDEKKQLGGTQMHLSLKT